MARHISASGLMKAKELEGTVLYTYDDADAGVPKRRFAPGMTPRGTLTIGHGHTAAAGEPVPVAGMNITADEAETILRRDIAGAESDVERLVKMPLNDNQFAALVLFQFNTGGLAKSELLTQLNKGCYEAVPAQLARWNKTTVGGKKVTSKGLANRRAAEIGLWATGAPVANNSVPAAPSVVPVITKENIGWGAGIAATLGSLFEGSGPVQWALGVVIVVAFAAAGFYFIRRRLR